MKTRNNLHNRTFKIFMLIAIILIFLFPFIMFASAEEKIAGFLLEKGYAVKQISEINIILPEEGLSFEIKNLSSIKSGLNKLHVQFFYNAEPFVKTDISVLIGRNSLNTGNDEKEQSEINEPLNITPAFKTVESYAIKKGDKVELIYQNNRLMIKAVGHAVNNARLNETAEFINLFSHKTVKGLVGTGRKVFIQ